MDVGAGVAAAVVGAGVGAVVVGMGVGTGVVGTGVGAGVGVSVGRGVNGVIVVVVVVGIGVMGWGVRGGKFVAGDGVETVLGGVGVGVTRVVGRGVTGMAVAVPGTHPQVAVRAGTTGQKASSMNPKIPARCRSRHVKGPCVGTVTTTSGNEILIPVPQTSQGGNPGDGGTGACPSTNDVEKRTTTTTTSMRLVCGRCMIIVVSRSLSLSLSLLPST